ncbi:MAG: hypothetical protein ISQ32_04150, partial [Rickettsiales bacterium]|nr:hypothetical protein [Rickettsiales bacterium]
SSLANLLVKSKNSNLITSKDRDPDSITAIEEIGFINERAASYIEQINIEDRARF